jgi:hypothetical protein
LKSYRSTRGFHHKQAGFHGKFSWLLTAITEHVGLPRRFYADPYLHVFVRRFPERQERPTLLAEYAVIEKDRRSGIVTL